MIASFRIYPKVRAGRGVGDYFVVNIYANVRLMRAAIRKSRGKYGFDHTLGLCAWYTSLRKVRGTWRRQRECGTIYFCRGYLGSGIVTHEMTHAAFAWLWKRKKWRPHWRSALEEPLAWTTGWLVAQFWTRYYERFKVK